MLSIIVTVYNIEKYLESCLESIINQTFKDLQIILVNDGSNDLSGHICKKYAVLDKRIEIVYQSNKGPHAARKQGLKHAKGEYVIFVDGDDVIKANLCERMMALIKENEADFVHCNFLINGKSFYKGIEKTEILNFDYMSNDEKKDFIADNILTNKNTNFITASIWSKIFKKTFVEKCFDKVNTNSRYGEDLLCLCYMIMIAHKGVLCTEAFYNYIERKGSLSHNYDICNLARISQMYYDLKKMFDFYGMTSKLDSALKEYYCADIVNSLSKIENNNFHFNQFYFSKVNDIRNKKIVIYGAGRVGRDYYDQLSRYKDIEIVAWVDKNADKYNYDYCKIAKPESIKLEDIDCILIAVNNKDVYNSIKNELVMLECNCDKILWEKPQNIMCEN